MAISIARKQEINLRTLEAIKASMGVFSVGSKDGEMDEVSHIAMFGVKGVKEDLVGMMSDGEWVILTLRSDNDGNVWSDSGVNKGTLNRDEHDDFYIAVDLHSGWDQNKFWNLQKV